MEMCEVQFYVNTISFVTAHEHKYLQIICVFQTILLTASQYYQYFDFYMKLFFCFFFKAGAFCMLNFQFLLLADDLRWQILWDMYIV